MLARMIGGVLGVDKCYSRDKTTETNHDIALAKFKEDGYYCKADIVSPHMFGVPQVRERMFYIMMLIDDGVGRGAGVCAMLVDAMWSTVYKLRKTLPMVPLSMYLFPENSVQVQIARRQAYLAIIRRNRKVVHKPSDTSEDDEGDDCEDPPNPPAKKRKVKVVWTAEHKKHVETVLPRIWNHPSLNKEVLQLCEAVPFVKKMCGRERDIVWAGTLQFKDSLRKMETVIDASLGRRSTILPRSISGSRVPADFPCMR
jgi:hypothetical protein